MTCSPNVREESRKQIKLARSQKILKMTKKKKSEETTGKGKSTESYVGKNTKGESYPAKRTRSSGPVMWDCPFCEDKKYADNLEYLVHLQKAHDCNLPGHAVKKKYRKANWEKCLKEKGNVKLSMSYFILLKCFVVCGSQEKRTLCI